MKSKTFFAIIFLFLFSACGLTSIVEQTPVHLSNALPDLAINNVYLSIQGQTGNCVTAGGSYEVRATVENRGFVTAVNIAVVETSSGYAVQIGELPAGQSMQVFLPASAPNGIYNISVDPQNLIQEIDESNNIATFIAPTPTPPLRCTPVPGSDETPSPVNGATLSLDVLRNGIYRSPDWGEYQLTDGIYYRTPPTAFESADAYTTRMQDPILFGDINADGLEDALVFLNTQNGGTGHFIEMAAVLNQNGSAFNVSTIYLGDRVGVESATVENGTIILNMRVQGPSDGLCCASQPVTWRFVLSGNQLVKLP